MQPAACRIAYRQPNHCDTNTSDFHRILTTNDTALTTALLYSRSMSSSKKAVPQIRRGVDASRQRRVIGLGSATGICVASMIGSGIFTVTGLFDATLYHGSNLVRKKLEIGKQH